MENIISIIQSKTNEIEFDVTTENLDTKGIKVFLVIKTRKMELRFNAKSKDQDTWIVKLPVLENILDKTTYNCYIEVISDGYHFIPMKGSINVMGSAEIYTSTPKNVSLEPDTTENDNKKKENKKDKVKEHFIPGKYRTKGREKSIEQLAAEMMVNDKKISEEVKKPLDKNENSPVKPIAESKQQEEKPKVPAGKKSTLGLARDFGVEQTTNDVTEEVYVNNEKDDKVAKALEEARQRKIDIKKQISESNNKPKKAVKTEPIQEKKKETVVMEDVETKESSDDKTIAILEEIGITPKRKPKFTIKEVKTKPLNS